MSFEIHKYLFCLGKKLSDVSVSYRSSWHRIVLSYSRLTQFPHIHTVKILRDIMHVGTHTKKYTQTLLLILQLCTLQHQCHNQISYLTRICKKTRTL